MKATWPNQERRRRRSSSPEASRRGQRPLPRYLTPGLPCLRAPSGVNFPPPEGDRTPRTPKNPSSSGSCQRRPPPDPPRSIHKAPAVAALRAACGDTGGDGVTGLRAGAAGPRPLRAAARPPPRKQQCTTGEGWGPHAARRRRRPPAETPASAPTRTRPLALTVAAPAPSSGRRQPEGPEARPPPQPAAAAAEGPTATTHTVVRHVRGSRPWGAVGPPAGRRGPAGRHLAAPRGRPRAPAPLGSVLT